MYWKEWMMKEGCEKEVNVLSKLLEKIEPVNA
jgi:hypothetical protein